MSKKEDLKTELYSIWNILIMAKECYSYSLYLYKPVTSEEREYLNKSSEFNFIRHILWRMAIIELSKLYSGQLEMNGEKERDRFNIQKLIRKLKVNGEFKSIGVDTQKITHWESLFRINKTTIERVIQLRDKVYAHTDANKNKFIANDIDFEDVKILIDIIEEILHDIFTTVFDTQLILDSPIFDNKGFKAIKILAEAEVKRKKDLYDEVIQKCNSNK